LIPAAHRGRFNSTGDSKVTSLNISSNKLDAVGAKIIAEAIKVRGLRAVFVVFRIVHHVCLPIAGALACVYKVMRLSDAVARVVSPYRTSRQYFTLILYPIN
jgi:hypothetical protein